MKLSNLEMSEKSIDVQENDKDVQENDMLLAEVRRQVNPLSFCACTHFIQRIHITPHRSSAEERGVLLVLPIATASRGGARRTQENDKVQTKLEISKTLSFSQKYI